MAAITNVVGALGAPASVVHSPRLSFYGRGGKRLFDIAASLTGLAILSPVLILCGLLVRLTSRGRVLFRQTRVGHRGRLFKVFKFRTMTQGAEALGTAVVIDHDQRLTRVGSFLRRTKLDELPQLINVLLGHMSTVGPRPRVPSEVDLRDPRERILLSVRPGVTSYASIHHRMEADYCARQSDPQEAYRTKVLPQKRLLDCKYVQNLTFLLDLKLIALTLVLVFIPGRATTTRLHVFGREMRPYSRAVQMVLDLALYISAAWVAYKVWFVGGFPAFYHRQMWLFVLFIPATRVLVHRALGVFDMMWRYTTVEDGLRLAVAFAPVTVVLLMLRFSLPTSSRAAVLFIVPLGVITLEYLVALTAGLVVRCLRRMLYLLHHQYQPLPEMEHRVLILGAGLLGLTTATDMRRYPHMRLVGYVDDDPAKQGRLMAGSRVLGNSDDLEHLCGCHQVTDVFCCAHSIEPARFLRLLERCSTLKVNLRLLPTLDQVLRQERICLIPSSRRKLCVRDLEGTL